MIDNKGNAFLSFFIQEGQTTLSSPSNSLIICIRAINIYDYCDTKIPGEAGKSYIEFYFNLSVAEG